MSALDREKWEARYADPAAPSKVPSVLLTSLGHLLPAGGGGKARAIAGGGGKALDVAGGGGRHAIWLAGRGWDTTIADISPRGLAIARSRAAAAGVTLREACVDLEQQPLPAGPWDLIVSFCYLQRSLFPRMIAALAPAGVLIVCQPTRSNLRRHTRPPADFLLDDGELPSLAEGLEIIHYREGWLEEGRHDALLVGRRP